jgi:hypothetical protein
LSWDSQQWKIPFRTGIQGNISQKLAFLMRKKIHCVLFTIWGTFGLSGSKQAIRDSAQCSDCVCQGTLGLDKLHSQNKI